MGAQTQTSPTAERDDQALDRLRQATGNVVAARLELAETRRESEALRVRLRAVRAHSVGHRVARGNFASLGYRAASSAAYHATAAN